MDLLPMILGAQSAQAARESVQEAMGWDRATAEREMFRAVRESGWAILVAPELWLVLEEHFAIRRYQARIETVQAAHDLVAAALEDIEILAVVEVSKEDEPLKLAEGEVVRTVKVGADVLSSRAGALAKLSAEITRAEEAMARRREALQRYAYAYQARHFEVMGMTLQQQAREILRMTLISGRYELAQELARVATGKEAGKLDSGFLGRMEASVKGLFQRVGK